MDTLPITIIIRTLNEEQNIEECIQYCKNNNPNEIIVEMVIPPIRQDRSFKESRTLRS